MKWDEPGGGGVEQIAVIAGIAVIGESQTSPLIDTDSPDRTEAQPICVNPTPIWDDLG